MNDEKKVASPIADRKTLNAESPSQAEIPFKDLRVCL